MDRDRGIGSEALPVVGAVAWDRGMSTRSRIFAYGEFRDDFGVAHSLRCAQLDFDPRNMNECHRGIFNAAIGARSRDISDHPELSGRRERPESKAEFLGIAGAVQTGTRAHRQKFQRGYRAAQQAKKSARRPWQAGGLP